MPTIAKTCCVYPEQSKPEGDVPPNTYGVPMKRIALRVKPAAIDDVRLIIPRAKRRIAPFLTCLVEVPSHIFRSALDVADSPSWKSRASARVSGATKLN